MYVGSCACHGSFQTKSVQPELIWLASAVYSLMMIRIQRCRN